MEGRQGCTEKYQGELLGLWGCCGESCRHFLHNCDLESPLKLLWLLFLFLLCWWLLFALFFFLQLAEDKGGALLASWLWIVGEKVGSFISCGSGMSVEDQLWLALFSLLMFPFPICSMGITQVLGINSLSIWSLHRQYSTEVLKMSIHKNNLLDSLAPCLWHITGHKDSARWN